MLMLIVTRERAKLIEISAGSPARAVSFSSDGKYLVSGGDEMVRLWRVEDGEQVGSMNAGAVSSIAVSKDGRRIASGSWTGVVTVWDAKTYKQVFVIHNKDHHTITGVDFSPDSTRLVTASRNGSVTIWDFVTRERVVGPLYHENCVVAAKYSPQGDRIATATYVCESVRIYNSHDGRLLMDIKAGVDGYCNTALGWSNDGQHLFAASFDGRIKQLNVSTGSVLSQWSVPRSNAADACMTLPKNGEFIVYAANDTITFWDAWTRSRLGAVIACGQEVCSVTLSPDDQLLAFAMEDGKISIKSLQHVLPVSILSKKKLLLRHGIR